MPYTAPDIKDRIALGDNKYATQTLPDNRTMLTPAPDSVAEPGTDINKALLQPLCRTVEQLDASMVPYTDHWWRRRSIAGTYYETQSNAYSGYSYTKTTFYYIYYYISIFANEYDTATLKYANSININQANGSISLASPTTVTVTESGYTTSQLQSMLAGKYVSGLLPNTTAIFYIPQTSYVVSRNWESAETGESTNYIGYEDSNDPGRGSLTKVMLPATAYSESIGAWSYVSSADSDTYPHNGVANGMTYEYIGKLFDTVLSTATPPAMTIVNYTSANFISDVYSVAVPYDRFLFAVINDDKFSVPQIIGVATKSNLSMVGLTAQSKAENADYNYFTFAAMTLGGFVPVVGAQSGGVGASAAVEVTSSGLKLYGTAFTSRSGKLMYMKL